MKQTETDVAIIGGGPAGLAAADARRPCPAALGALARPGLRPETAARPPLRMLPQPPALLAAHAPQTQAASPGRQTQ